MTSIKKLLNIKSVKTFIFLLYTSVLIIQSDIYINSINNTIKIVYTGNTDLYLCNCAHNILITVINIIQFYITLVHSECLTMHN